MALLFVGGVMNLYWIVALAVLVLLEKTIPVGHWLGSVTGIGLMVWGGLAFSRNAVMTAWRRSRFLQKSGLSTLLTIPPSRCQFGLLFGRR